MLETCDLLLHPIAPFVTDYLANKCFGTEALLTEDWPDSKAQYRNERLEVEFDVLASSVSLTNAARMKAKVKRRWPLRKAFYLLGKEERDLLLENKALLIEQTNLSDVELVTDPTGTPIRVVAKPNFQIVAPRVGARMNELSGKLAKTDAAWLFNELARNGKARLPEMTDFELTQSDVDFSFVSSDQKFVVSENFGIVVALDSSRDDQLIAQGVIRDLARNLQSIRKEKGFNPTDILNVARVHGLASQMLSQIEQRKDELAFLVRVKNVELSSEKSTESESWRSADIDGVEVRLDVS